MFPKICLICILLITVPVRGMSLVQRLVSGSPLELSFQDTVMYIAADRSLRIIDISNPLNAIEVGRYQDGTTSFKAVAVGKTSIVYCLDTTTGKIIVLDCSVPSSVRVISEYRGLRYAGNIIADADRDLLIVSERDAISILSIADNTNIVRLSRMVASSYPQKMFLEGTILHTVWWVHGYVAINIRYPAWPRIVGRNDFNGQAVDVVVNDNYVYIANKLTQNQILRGSRLVGSYPLRRSSGVAFLNDRLYFADREAGLIELSLSNPARPAHLDRYSSGFRRVFTYRGVVYGLDEGKSAVFIFEPTPLTQTPTAVPTLVPPTPAPPTPLPSTPIPPTPIPPTPVPPTPVPATPVPPTPVPPTPIPPTPIPPTPVPPTPVPATPVPPTPVPPTPIPPTPIPPTPVPPTPVPATPVPPTPVPPTPIPPTPIPPTPIPPTPVPATPVPPTPIPPTPIPPTPVPATPVPPTPVPPTPIPPTPIPPTPVPPTPIPPTPIPQTPIPATPVPPTPIPPTPAPATPVPPTPIPPTPIPPTPVPPTPIPPTPIPPTPIPPTPIPPTPIPPTPVPATPVPPTPIPPTPIPPTPVPATPVPPTPILPTPIPPAPVPATPIPPTPVQLTPVPPTPISSTPIPPTRVPPMAASPTAVPPALVPPTQVPLTSVPLTPTQPTLVPQTPMPPAPVPTSAPTAMPRVPVPPIPIPPTAIPPTPVPLTSVPPTLVHQTAVPPTPVPPTPIPTAIPPTPVPLTPVPPTLVHQTAVPPIPVPPIPIPQTAIPPTPVPLTSVPPTLVHQTAVPPTPPIPQTPVPTAILPTAAPTSTPTKPFLLTPVPLTQVPLTMVPSLLSTTVPPTPVPLTLMPSASVSPTSTYMSTATPTPVLITEVPSTAVALTQIPTTVLLRNQITRTPPTSSPTLISSLVILTEVPTASKPLSEVAEKVTESFKSSSSVVATASVATLIAGSGSSGGPAVRLAVTATILKCMGDDNHGDGLHDEDDLSRLIHPLGFRIGGSPHAGSIVGNIAICVGTTALVTAAIYAISNLLGKDIEIMSSIIRYPSVTAMIPMFLFGGIVQSSVELLAYPRGIMYTLSGVMGIVFGGGFLFIMFCVGRKEVFNSQLEPALERNTFSKFMLGSHTWISIEGNHLEKMGALFDVLTEHSDKGIKSIFRRGRYMMFELFHLLVLASLSVFRALSYESCAAKSFSLGTVMLSHVVITVYLQPFLALFLNRLMIMTSLLPTIGLFAAGVGYLLHDSQHWTITFAAITFFSAMMGALIRTAYEVITWMMDVCSYKSKENCSQPPSNADESDGFIELQNVSNTELTSEMDMSHDRNDFLALIEEELRKPGSFYSSRSVTGKNWSPTFSSIRTHTPDVTAVPHRTPDHSSRHRRKSHPVFPKPNRRPSLSSSVNINKFSPVQVLV